MPARATLPVVSKSPSPHKAGARDAGAGGSESLTLGNGSKQKLPRCPNPVLAPTPLRTRRANEICHANGSAREREKEISDILLNTALYGVPDPSHRARQQHPSGPFVTPQWVSPLREKQPVTEGISQRIKVGGAGRDARFCPPW